jgi:hypothetical protein
MTMVKSLCAFADQIDTVVGVRCKRIQSKKLDLFKTGILHKLSAGNPTGTSMVRQEADNENSIAESDYLNNTFT